MLKTAGIITAVSTAFIFGGGAQPEADANGDSQNVSHQIHYNINGEKGSIASDSLKQLLSEKKLSIPDYISDKNEDVNGDSQNVSYQMYYNVNGEKGSISGGDLKQLLSEENISIPDNIDDKKENADSDKQQGNEKQEKPETEQSEESQQQDSEQISEREQLEEQQTQQEHESQEQSDIGEFESQVVELTNQERINHGLEPLEIDPQLSEVAEAKSNDMAENGYFSHNSPTYGSPFDMMQSFGVDYQTAGENIARGQSTPQQVVDGWMNSSGHRANILNPDYTHIGVGYDEDGNFWTQQFIGK